jgi:deazaflavin-dependent oxidoreductase (nitroreductase family)
VWPTLGLVFAGALVVALRALPAVSYGPHGPTTIGRFFVSAWARWAVAGLPPSWVVALEVRGRKTGRKQVIPLVLARWGGDDYLVSMLGESASWVRNVRAAGGEAVLIHGRRRAVTLREVDPAERAPILKAYLARAIGGRPHIPVSHDAPVEAFEPIANRYPVFRLEPGR